MHAFVYLDVYRVPAKEAYNVVRKLCGEKNFEKRGVPKRYLPRRKKIHCSRIGKFLSVKPVPQAYTTCDVRVSAWSWLMGTGRIGLPGFLGPTKSVATAWSPRLGNTVGSKKVLCLAPVLACVRKHTGPYYNFHARVDASARQKRRDLIVGLGPRESGQSASIFLRPWKKMKTQGPKTRDPDTAPAYVWAYVRMRAKAYGWVRYPTTIARTQSRLLARQNRVRLIVGLGTHVSCTTMRFLPARVKRAKCGAKSVRARYASRTEKKFFARVWCGAYPTTISRARSYLLAR